MTEHAPQPVDRFPEYPACKAVTTRALETMASNGTPPNVRDLYSSAIGLSDQYNDRLFAWHTQYDLPYPWYVIKRDGLVYASAQTPFTVGVNPTTGEVRVQPSDRSHVPGIIEGKYGMSITPGTESAAGTVTVTDRFQPLAGSDLTPEEIERITAAMKAIREADRRSSERVTSDAGHIDELYVALQLLFPQGDVHL